MAHYSAGLKDKLTLKHLRKEQKVDNNVSNIGGITIETSSLAGDDKDIQEIIKANESESLTEEHANVKVSMKKPVAGQSNKFEIEEDKLDDDDDIGAPSSQT